MLGSLHKLKVLAWVIIVALQIVILPYLTYDLQWNVKAHATFSVTADSELIQNLLWEL